MLKTLTQKLMSERAYQFWALNLFGWLGYGFFVSLSAFLWQKNLMFQVFYAAFATVFGLILSLVMRACYRRFWNMAPIARSLYSLLVVAVATGLWAYIKMIAFREGVGQPEHVDVISEYIAWYTYSFFILLSWAALYFGIKYYQMLQEERRRTLKATAMAHQAQLKMLRYQLNPHFLFNTLNAISTLILESQTRVANTMVTELSKFLRYSLENDPMQKVTLAQEIVALELYLNIEKVRFEERLRLNFDVDDKARAGLIPSMLLQPLVENSIKYAVSKNESGGTISLVAKVFAGELLIEVADDGPGIEMVDNKLPAFKGVGLCNFKERLAEIYAADHACQFSNIKPNGLKISIRIPYETHVPEAAK
ncbi:sensor histidine kinase [Agarilytica rhodophyticola]|uniref:sensor histidine kinase n=1 Tax=Agarilytica rhodophyticola TaxID=1737490 RepID=UPI000B343EA5|nr:histidine kinase [Agarilytica rhodophyticola]